uniref:Uncharacterized protein n=1 Tax=Anguilla anguilla TaxID=7936 RepID=A0A0E9XV51_ANGAN
MEMNQSTLTFPLTQWLEENFRHILW